MKKLNLTEYILIVFLIIWIYINTVSLIQSIICPDLTIMEVVDLIPETIRLIFKHCKT